MDSAPAKEYKRKSKNVFSGFASKVCFVTGIYIHSSIQRYISRTEKTEPFFSRDEGQDEMYDRGFFFLPKEILEKELKIPASQ